MWAASSDAQDRVVSETERHLPEEPTEMFPSAEYLASAEIAYRRDRAAREIRSSRVRRASSRRRRHHEPLPDQRLEDGPTL